MQNLGLFLEGIVMMAVRGDAVLAAISGFYRIYQTPVERVQATMDYLHDQFPENYWVGIYLLRGDMLELGPFKGPPTDHVRIPVGKGVCGTAVATNQNQNVADVSQLQNYLACNLNTKSELVVLIRDPDTKEILGQIDFDGRKLQQFSATDEQLIEQVAVKIAKDIKHLRTLP